MVFDIFTRVPVLPLPEMSEVTPVCVEVEEVGAGVVTEIDMFELFEPPEPVQVMI